MVPSWNNSNVPSPSLVVVLAAGMELTLLVSLSLFLFHWTSSKLTDNYSSHLKETRGKLGLKVTSLSFIPKIKSPKAKLPLMNFFILPVRHKRNSKTKRLRSFISNNDWLITLILKMFLAFCYIILDVHFWYNRRQTSNCDTYDVANQGQLLLL